MFTALNGTKSPLGQLLAIARRVAEHNPRFPLIDPLTSQRYNSLLSAVVSHTLALVVDFFNLIFLYQLLRL